MELKLKFRNLFLISLPLVVCLSFIIASVGHARPDFDVHPRTIEAAFGWWGVNVNLLIENDGDEDLEWSVSIPEEDEDWLYFRNNSPEEGVIEAGGDDTVFVKLYGRNIEEDHVESIIHFESNDPTREEYEVPVAGHNAPYPRINAWWPNEGWGAWWGIDLNMVYGDIYWGQVYDTTIAIVNWGLDTLEVEEINSNNGYFEIAPDSFSLLPESSRWVNLIFSAEEVDYNVATITSVSNAWDPRELNFRITADVSPVFRLRSPLPNITMDEDADEILVADLDSIFVSSDNTVEFRTSHTPVLISRIERNGHFSIQPSRDWNGITDVVVFATLEDSVLSDTFSLQVNAIPDPPDFFDLLSPADAQIIRSDVDSAFVWQSAMDPDNDIVTYEVFITPTLSGETTLWQVESDTTLDITVLNEIINADVGGEFTWTVSAADSDFVVDAWSVFTNTLAPLGLENLIENYQMEFAILDVFPNPFNSQVNLKISTAIPATIDMSIFDLNGKLLLHRYSNLANPGIHHITWQAGDLPSGTYMLRLDEGDKQLNHLLHFIR